MAAAMDASESPAEATSSDSSPNRSHGMPWQQKLQTAMEYKAAGNQLYKSKAYKAAISKYHRALLYIKGIDTAQESNSLLQNFGGGDYISPELSPEGRVATNDVKRDCYNNLAACILQTETPSYHKVLQYCDEVLHLFPSNVKAMYRKGVALYELKEAEQAHEVLTKASYLPDGQKDGNIRKYLRLCEQELSRQDQKMKNTYRAMFEKLTVGETETDSSSSQSTQSTQPQNGAMDT